MSDKIDENLEKILKATGSKLDYYMPVYKKQLRDAMRKIMSESYLAGCDDCASATGIRPLKKPQIK